MPTYDYECTVCKHTFEAFQSIKAAPLETCPVCGNKLRRLIGGGIGVIFKGSGFYSTDYRKSEYIEKQKKDVPPTCPPAKSEGCKAHPKAKE